METNSYVHDLQDALAINLSAYRKNRKLSQEVLAEKAKVELEMIQCLERQEFMWYFANYTHFPTYSLLDNILTAFNKIAEALGCTVDDLIKLKSYETLTLGSLYRPKK